VEKLRWKKNTDGYVAVPSEVFSPIVAAMIDAGHFDFASLERVYHVKFERTADQVYFKENLCEKHVLDAGDDDWNYGTPTKYW
jgi:hypothetical protein